AASDPLLPARHGPDVCLHGGVAISLGYLWVPAREEFRFRGGLPGRLLRLLWRLFGCLICHCVHPGLFTRMNRGYSIMGAMSQEKSEAAPEIPVVLCARSLKKAWQRPFSRLF